MKKLWYVLLLVFIALTFSCEIGLGSSVDTDPPTIDITTPPVDSIIRDSFLIGGNWSDDGEIAGVSVSLKKTDGTGSEITLTGSLTENRASAQQECRQERHACRHSRHRHDRAPHSGVAGCGCGRVPAGS